MATSYLYSGIRQETRGGLATKHELSVLCVLSTGLAYVLCVFCVFCVVCMSCTFYVCDVHVY